MEPASDKPRPARWKCHWQPYEVAMLLARLRMAEPIGSVAAKLDRDAAGCGDKLKRLIAGTDECPADSLEALAELKARMAPKPAAAKRDAVDAASLASLHRGVNALNQMASASQRLTIAALACELLRGTVTGNEMRELIGDGRLMMAVVRQAQAVLDKRKSPQLPLTGDAAGPPATDIGRADPPLSIETAPTEPKQT